MRRASGNPLTMRQPNGIHWSTPFVRNSRFIGGIGPLL
jgi:hypothetical protein